MKCSGTHRVSALPMIKLQPPPRPQDQPLRLSRTEHVVANTDALTETAAHHLDSVEPGLHTVAPTKQGQTLHHQH